MLMHFGEAVARAIGRRTGAPVHRNSKKAGQCEAGIWRKTTRQDVRQIVLAARRYEVARKERGSRNGPLGSVALEILDYLANIVDFKTGRLEPSIDTMKQKLRRSRDAIVRGLKALRDHGFVDWLRRYVPVDNAGKGPQVKQTSNAYRLVMPARARAFLGRYGTPPPSPDDVVQTLAERADAATDYLKSLALDDLALDQLGDTPLGQAVARLGRNLMKQRESAGQTESKSEIISKRE